MEEMHRARYRGSSRDNAYESEQSFGVFAMPLLVRGCRRQRSKGQLLTSKDVGSEEGMRGVRLTLRRLLVTGRHEIWPLSPNSLNPVSSSVFLARLMRWLRG